MCGILCYHFTKEKRQVNSVLRAILCDDDALILKQVKGLLQQLGRELNIVFEIQCFTSAEELLFGYPQKADLLFLDVQMKKITGIEAARAIRQRDKLVSIVFMSSYAQYAVDGYEVQAYRYLLKPVSQIQFREEITDLALRLENSRKRSVYIATREVSYSLAPQDILYIETLPDKHLGFHCRSSRIEVPGTIGSWENQLAEQDFFRCHHAYLVNLAYISRLGKEDLLLSDGSVLPVSRRRKKELSEAFYHYMKNIL